MTEQATKIYHFTNVTPEENEQLRTKRKMMELLAATFDDDLQGKVDYKKYQEIQKLAAKLPAAPPGAGKKSFWGRAFHR